MPLNDNICLCEALKLVPRQWRGEFTRFVEEGEGTDEFLVFLASDEPTRRACEMVLRSDRELAQLIKTVEEPHSPVEPPRQVAGVS